MFVFTYEWLKMFVFMYNAAPMREISPFKKSHSISPVPRASDYKKTGTCLEFFLCLPRAYLGEMIVSCKKWNKQYRFSYLPRGAAATEICLATERLTDELRPCIACIMGCITQ